MPSSRRLCGAALHWHGAAGVLCGQYCAGSLVLQKCSQRRNQLAACLVLDAFAFLLPGVVATITAMHVIRKDKKQVPKTSPKTDAKAMKMLRESGTAPHGKTALFTP